MTNKNEMINEKERYIDLHTHTTGSDGDSSPEEMIRAARKAGLSALAITDHNCFTLDTPIIRDGLEVIPGAEFSTTYRYGNGGKREVHIVGLFFDGVDPAMNAVFDGIDKHAYVAAIIKKLNTLGVRVSMEELMERNHVSRQFGRHQVADLLVEKGYSPDRPTAMDQWVGNFSPYYINSLDYIHYMDMEECVRRICQSKSAAGVHGMPVLAHPFHYRFTKPEIEELVCRYRETTDAPLAMEVYYGKYDDAQMEYLESLADKYNLFPSAGSDRHRPAQPFVRGGYSLLEDMKNAVGMRSCGSVTGMQDGQSEENIL